VIGVTDPLNKRSESRYDGLSRVVGKTDAKGSVTSFAYDALGRLIRSTDTSSGTATQTFDANGNRLSFTDATGNRTSFEYDAANRVTHVTTADGGAITYTYTLQNQVATAINGRGQAATYLYDAAGRLTSMADSAGTIHFSYDANGNILTATDVAGTTSYTYDAADQLSSFTDVFGNRIAYGYDAGGNLITLTYPGNKVVTYTYFQGKDVTLVTDWANRIISHTRMGDQLIAIRRPNGVITSYTYDANEQQTSVSETFGPMGPSGPLGPTYSIAYTYDANGNITSEVPTPLLPLPALASSAMSYGPDNRLAAMNGRAATFDADGNMTSGPDNGAISSFSFDARSRLTGVGASSYEYNARGHRIAATHAGVTTRYVIDPNAALPRVLMETTATGIPVAYYVYGPTGLLSRESASGAYQTYHYDLRGSTLRLADVRGVVTDSYTYGPFGELLTSSGTTQQPFKYNGRDGVMTEPNGLYYMRARYYSPEAKRFVSRDSLLGNLTESMSLNRFAYVNGNPVRFVDPSGLSSMGQFSMGQALGAAAYGGIEGAITGAGVAGVATFGVGGLPGALIGGFLGATMGFSANAVTQIMMGNMPVTPKDVVDDSELIQNISTGNIRKSAINIGKSLIEALFIKVGSDLFDPKPKSESVPTIILDPNKLRLNQLLGKTC
jgi:RHS repeat-associated protein